MILADATPIPLAALAAPPTLGAAPDPRLHGVSLAEYAAVLAGLAEGHQLGRVLAHEGIKAAHWPAAQEAWSDRLAEAAGAEDDLQGTFDEHLAVAQDRYGRRLPPLDQDLRAFLDFRRRWSMDADPHALLERLGLRIGEVARLCRLWSKRLAADPALAAEELALLREEPGALPVVAPTPVELSPAPPVPEAKDAALDDEERTVDDEVPLFAPVSGRGAGRGLDESVDDGPAASAVADAAEPPPAAPGRRPRPSFLLTGPLAVPSFAPVPPLTGRAPAAPPGDAPPEEGALVTAPMPIVLPSATLPFHAPDATRVSHAAKPGHATAFGADVPSRAPRPQTDTATFESLSLAAVLPFLSPGAGDGATPPSGDVARGRGELAGGAGPSGTAPMPALTGAPEARSAAAHPTASTTAAEPTQPRKITTRLSVGSYAAFCAELSVFPGQFRETFQRYGFVSPQDAIDLASAWQERFLEVPAEFDTWERLHRLYLDYCRTKGRPEVEP